MKSKTVLITRPYEQSVNTANDLKSNQFNILIEPLLNIEYLNSAIKDFHKKFSNQTIIITSKHSLYFLRNANINKKHTIITVGKKSYDLAKEFGFLDVKFANGNLDELKKFILHKYLPNHQFIYLSGTRLSGDLNNFLLSNKYLVEQIYVYKSNPIDCFSVNLKNNLLSQNIDVALFYSKFTAQTFIKLITKNNFVSYSAKIKIICLSEKIAIEFLKLGYFEDINVFKNIDKVYLENII